MIPGPPRRRALIVAAWAAPFASCNVLSSAPAPQIYRLSPLADEPPPRRVLRKRLVIDIPTASESLDTDRIALIRDRTRFDYYANSLWTDRVPVLVQTLLVEAFESDGGFAEVGRDAQALTPEYLLKTEVRRFEAVYVSAADKTPAVVAAIDLGLVKMPDHRMLGHTLVTSSSTASRNTLDSIVEAFDVTLGKILAECVDWTRSVMSRSA
jgi:cholesterol transport system auxiliary component